LPRARAAARAAAAPADRRSAPGAAYGEGAIGRRRSGRVEPTSDCQPSAARWRRRCWSAGDQGLVERAQRVAVRGAVIAGKLDVHDASVVGLALTGCRLGPIDLRRATFTGDARFDGTTFTGDARFDGTTFTGDARFDGTTFTGDAWFDGTTFTGDARFDGTTFTGDARFDGTTFTRDAWFDGTTFTGDARFDGTTFTGDARFDGTTFTGDARFDGTTFTGDARFDGTTFTRDAWFSKATFTGAAWFSKATFTGAARFDGATFTRAAWFSKATFTGAARFDGATFTRAAWFGGALAERWDLSRSRFESPDPGPWSGSEVILTHASLQVRSRVDIVASHANCAGLQVREGAHLVIRAGADDAHLNLPRVAHRNCSTLSLSWNSSRGSGACLHNGPMSGSQFVRPDRIGAQVLERAGCGINPSRSRR
jgi:Pentapeptide repeats (9 copies)